MDNPDSSASQDFRLDTKLISMRFEEVKQKLLEKLAQGAIFRRDNILTNGQIADIALDVKEVTLSAEGLFLASMAILHNLQDQVEAIGSNSSITYSLPSTTALLAYIRGQELTSFYVRNQPRQFGFSKWIEGPLKQGAKICLVQDQVRDSDTLVKLIRKVSEEADAQIIQVIGLVDISKAVESRMFDLGIHYTPIIRLKDILKLIPDAELLVQEDYHAKV
ncbi:MAG: hypothetical protein ACKO3R_00705 [bacterium]